MSKLPIYTTGADMWKDYKECYGDEARGICNRYLDMQVFTKDPEELQFCKELYDAMQDDLQITKQQKESVLAILEKAKSTFIAHEHGAGKSVVKKRPSDMEL